MTGVPKFNFPMFNAVAAKLREMGFDEVFNPAENDIKMYGVDPSELSPNGDPKELVAKFPQFDLRKTLLADFTFICSEATHIAFLPGWEKSSGARAEHSVAVAVGLEIIYVS